MKYTVLQKCVYVALCRNDWQSLSLFFFLKEIKLHASSASFWPYYLDVMNTLTEYCQVLQYIA